MYRFRDLCPLGHLLLVEQTGNPGIAEPFWSGRRALSDDQSGGGALAVVLHHQVVRHIAQGAVPRPGRHHEVILERE